jgi:hypothetical protein
VGGCGLNPDMPRDEDFGGRIFVCKMWPGKPDSARLCGVLFDGPATVEAYFHKAYERRDSSIGNIWKKSY